MVEIKNLDITLFLCCHTIKDLTQVEGNSILEILQDKDSTLGILEDEDSTLGIL